MEESGGQKREEELSGFSSARGWGLSGEGRGFQHPGGGVLLAEDRRPTDQWPVIAGWCRRQWKK